MVAVREELAEILLRDYLLNHPPYPFGTLLRCGIDPTKTSYLVFRDPEMLNDLVISIKFVRETRRSRGSNLNRQKEDDALGKHWEQELCENDVFAVWLGC